jgi:plasmid rolling circle replication initiator protein Rep
MVASKFFTLLLNEDTWTEHQHFICLFCLRSEYLQQFSFEKKTIVAKLLNICHGLQDALKKYKPYKFFIF